MNLPTVKQLRYFVALEKTEHFGKAAQACFVSQSAFSVAIRELESLLGSQLVDRTNKTVTITRVGKEVAAQANRCLRDIEYLTAIASHSEEPLSSRLTLGAIPTIAPFVLPKLLPALRDEFPDLQLYLHEGTTLSIYEKLIEGELDLLLIALPYKLAGVEILPLFKDHFELACREDTQFLDPKKDYVEEDLPAESILLLEDGHCLRDHALSACRIRNQDTVNRFSASSLATLIEMVNSDLGVTYLTKMTKSAPMLQHTKIKTWPLPNNPYREIGMVWRKNSAQAEEFRILGEFIKNISGIQHVSS
ncbi:MAG: Hydrogen peroxide-inducible genes activator [uncultured Thiotrichaceae bacterium]|uniref:Hydrogen peroxide-inducible genes activator n=1 Tax=uncultured Thiotrichaceae bacterium TaxID=298394 RepID=A0A6S6SMQ4_9GAMM|nr:MAG: Hydrogen peroxide-inducible genes activator [uncultured Thiotrichaceae bacterium]